MHNLQAEDRSHLRMVSVRDSARISLPSELPIAPLRRDHRHQLPHPTELSGAGTWTLSGADESHHSRALDALRLPVTSATRDHSQQQHHVIHASPDSTPVLEEDVRLFATSDSSSLNHCASFDVVRGLHLQTEQFDTITTFVTRSRPGNKVDDDCTVAGAEEFQDTDDDNISLVHTPLEYDHSIEEVSRAKRPLIDYLSPPVGLPIGLSPALSVISDAGHQQQLRQEQAVVSCAEEDEPVHKRNDSFNPVPELPPIFDLQGSIFHALVPTRKNDSHIPGFGFLPQMQLYNVVNPESVAAQLKTDLSATHTFDKISFYANAVCKKSEVFYRGKTRVKSFQKIFAILVLVEMSSSISHFLEEDVSDLDLPLMPIRQHGMVVDFRRQEPSGESSSMPLKCFSRNLWSIAKLRNFERDQWIMLAPFFSQGEHGEVKHYKLQDQHILPYLAEQQAEGDDAEYHGGFAKVMMVRVHPDHHNFKDRKLCERGFAIKQLYDNDRVSFQREVRMLKKFSGARTHKHIVALLATYEQRDKFHFIFYRAGGDLFRYWRELKPKPVVDYTNIVWVAEQCAGLAEGLMKLHKHLTFTIRHKDMEGQAIQKPAGEKRVVFAETYRHVRSDSIQSNGVRVLPESPTWRSFHTATERSKHPDLPPNTEVIQEEQFGRHGDINPGNILWYHNSPEGSATQNGTLKIADFGQAELNSLKSRTRQRSVANTMTYRPPECDLSPRIIRQSYDIWCLGCVYLEFIAWMLGGETLLTTFASRRRAKDRFLNNEITDTFFEFVSNPYNAQVEVKIKSVVIEFIEELHRRPKCTEYFHELLVMIQCDMLVVDSKERESCEQIKQKLDHLYKKCHDDIAYASGPRPWSMSGSPKADSSQRSVKLDMSDEAQRKIAENLQVKQVLSRLQRKRTGLNGQHIGFSAPESQSN